MLVNAAGEIVGEDKASGIAWFVTTPPPGGGGHVSYGGESDAWGLTLKGADVKNANFGVVLSAYYTSLTVQ
jgi:hypothetical protein